MSAPRSVDNTGDRRHYVYVIELNDAVGPRKDARFPSVYVGQSVHEPAVRFRQHLDGYKASRYVKRYGKFLRPRLYRSMNPMPSRDAALAAEAEVARRLRRRGYTVYGGH
ncbi:MAG: hypothetical protein M3P23_09205 [Actinomycetota bacterium]|nr:hypothetical protein [Actinomycetota bacterium]